MTFFTSNVACDYYNWFQGDIQGINAYHREYMSQFSWSEFTYGGINMTSNKSIKLRNILFNGLFIDALSTPDLL